jgi:hypothetical protein
MSRRPKTMKKNARTSTYNRALCDSDFMLKMLRNEANEKRAYGDFSI